MVFLGTLGPLLAQPQCSLEETKHCSFSLQVIKGIPQLGHTMSGQLLSAADSKPFQPVSEFLAFLSSLPLAFSSASTHFPFSLPE
jgi:hypothetical protein